MNNKKDIYYHLKMYMNSCNKPCNSFTALSVINDNIYRKKLRFAKIIIFSLLSFQYSFRKS